MSRHLRTLQHLRATLPILILCGLLAGACDEDRPTGLDLEGRRVDPLGRPGVTALYFIMGDCPVSGRTAPSIERLTTDYAARGVASWLVYPDPADDAKAIEAHRAEFGLTAPALRDPEHALVDAAKVLTAPSAAVFVDGRLVYRGRIDDRVTGYGQARLEASQHELSDALDAALAGRAPAVAETKSIGCPLGDLR